MVRFLSDTLKILVWALWLSRCALALPNDQQILQLYQQWSSGLSQASSFNSLAGLLSRTSCQRIIQLSPTVQAEFFRSVKATSVIENSPAWLVQDRLIEGGSLVYVLLNRESNSRAVLRVVEEDGQLKVELSPP